jgi:hypothetical protein
MVRYTSKNIIDIITNQFESIIPTYKFHVIQNKGSGYEFHYLSDIKVTENVCFKLSILIDQMYISDLKYPCEKNCFLSGPEILVQLYFIAKILGCSSIRLGDASSLYRLPLFCGVFV